ncbi:MAG: hypothetical protein NC253_09700 [Ruminococcus sp.]|nr:hypothetical protein [Ruminococcus sp.]MCM1381502.1 hypothetical protein [Muribaculaceae bacterium]MCM1480351.1 hypothetical protein [Muribaculaceae bacterium]
MSNKSRERNYVDAFSDYGMDERQIAVQNKIMSKCFKALFYGAAVLTCVWLILPTLTGLQFPAEYVAASYFLLAVICSNAYSIMASKHGAINGITATAWEGKGSIIIILFVALPLLTRFFADDEFKLDPPAVTIIILSAAAVANAVVSHICGKRNFKALDGETDEDNEEE